MMYLPRLRAKQYDISAVRNAVTAGLDSASVRPVLEPVTELNSSWVSRVKALGELGLRCDLVLNPGVGLYAGSWQTVADVYLSAGLLETNDLAILSDSNADHAGMAEWVDRARAETEALAIDVIHEPGGSTVLRGDTYTQVRHNIAEDRTAALNIGLPLSAQPYIWANDPFPAEEKNADYVGRSESIFTTRPAGFRSAGYEGLSDFLINGRRFRAKGGPAYAVALHLTYQSEGAVRLVHFCSDSNDNTDDPAGKFREALAKLIEFVQMNDISKNPAIRTLEDLHQRKHFPNLGKVKETLMINHMFVMVGAMSAGAV